MLKTGQHRACEVTSLVHESGYLNSTVARHYSFTNCKDATSSCSKHEASGCHKEAVQSIVVHPHTTRDRSEQLSKVHA